MSARPVVLFRKSAQRSSRVRKVALVLAALLVPSALHAQGCGSVGNFASTVWDRYVDEAREAGCMAPVSGPRKYVACSIRAYANNLHIVDRMVGWWNTMADGGWGTVGPRRLDPEWQEGTVVGTSGRLWMGTAPVNTAKAVVEVSKEDGRVPAEVVVCASRDDGSTREIGRYRFEGGTANVGETMRATFAGLEAELLSVKVDGKGVVPTNRFAYRIRLQTEPRRYDLGPVKGFADLHLHQAAQLGFGGNQLWGSHIGPQREALPECGSGTVVGELVASFPLPRVNTLHGLVPFNLSVGEGEARHGHGAPGFGDWPHFNDVLHQQVHEDWLKQAHDGGLALAVVSAVNFEGLCYFLKAMYPRPNDRLGCRDMESVEAQIQAFIDMDERRDWYEIAMDPWHARKIIHDGKLAVVISLEASHLFPLDRGPPITQLDRLHAMGLRTLQLAHETDSRFAGAAPHRKLFGVFQMIKWPDPGRRAFELASFDLLEALRGFRLDAAGKNSVGLRPPGRELVEAMIDRHMLIDIAHLSERSVDNLYQLVATEHAYYPLYDSHTRFEYLLTEADRETQREFVTTREQMDFIRATGGMVGLRTGQNAILTVLGADGEGVLNDCDGSSKSFAQLVHSGAQAGIQMGLGSDFNGFINQLGPRFGPDACPAGEPPAEESGAPVADADPADLIGNADPADLMTDTDPRDVAAAVGDGLPREPLGALRHRCELPGLGDGGRDFHREGLRHVGYLPDLVADLEALGTPGIDVLKSSAEAFLRMWERTYDAGRTKIADDEDLAGQVAETVDWSACAELRESLGVLANLGGNWVRVESNHPPNNGMRVRFDGERATLTSMPPGGHRNFRVGHLLWREVTADGSLEVRGSDGAYYPSLITMEGPDRLHIDVDRANSPGNDQTWERAGPSVDGTWVLVGGDDESDRGLQVRVEGDRGTVRYLPAAAGSGLRVGDVLWRGIGAGGKLEARTGGRAYRPGRVELVGEDRLRVVVETAGERITQAWARKGSEAEHAGAADLPGAAPRPLPGEGNDPARGPSLAPPSEAPQTSSSPPASGQAPLALAETGVAAIVGVVPDGAVPRGGGRPAPAGRPVQVESFDEFASHFSGTPPLSHQWGEEDAAALRHLQLAVRGFFANGGRRAWVLRVASRDDLGDLRDELRALRDLDVDLVVVPGASEPSQREAVLDHVEAVEDRFALLDAPSGADPSRSRELLGTRSSDRAVVLFPWIEIADPTTGRPVAQPPSGHVAGALARSDRERGVHVAPGNLPIAEARGATAPLTPAQLEALTLEGVLALRPGNPSGLVTWGGRTLGGDANGSFRYVSVRRSMDRVTETLAEALGAHACADALAPAEALLEHLWREGALQGTRASQAYFVRCAASGDALEMGLSLLKPEEFVLASVPISEAAPP